MHYEPKNVDWPQSDQEIRVSQVIVLALCCGLLTFLAISVVLRNFAVSFQPDSMTIIGGGAFAVLVVASFVVPRIVSSGAATKAMLDAGENPQAASRQMFGAFQVGLIMRCAMIEGAGFFNTVMYWLNSNGLSLLLAATCAVLIGTQMPSKMKILHWIADSLNGR